MKMVKKENLPNLDQAVISRIVIDGDISGLNPQQKVLYYQHFCDRIGLDPITKPFEIIKLQGKEVIYCKREGAQQLNKKYNVSHHIISRDFQTEICIVTCRASVPDGRFQESIGVVPVVYPDTIKVWDDKLKKTVWKPNEKAGKKLTAEDLSNAIMKAETKAKRRATLDLLGLGIMDETEIEAMQNNFNSQRSEKEIQGEDATISWEGVHIKEDMICTDGRKIIDMTMAELDSLYKILDKTQQEDLTAIMKKKCELRARDLCTAMSKVWNATEWEKMSLDMMRTAVNNLLLEKKEMDKKAVKK